MFRKLLLASILSVAMLFAVTESELLNSDDILYYSIRQYTKLSLSLNGKNGFISTGNPLSPEWNLSEVGAWTVGFYGGSLWMLYKLTHDDYWKSLALEYQERVKPRQFDTGTHDVGFVIMSTYGLALEYGNITDNATRREYEQIINQTATSLSTRFHPLSGCLRSWNTHQGSEVTVIIDNMMNLELLFRAHEITGNATFVEIALSHANRTIEEHFREDYGVFHVVGYNETNGEVARKYNAQGMADNSTWSRGLAWAIHGYTTTYQFTGIELYLETAEKAASYFIERLPQEDSVAYWDFNAPLDNGEYQPRDTAAATIAAHAFLNLYEITGNKSRYFDTAEAILNGLENYKANSKPEYQIPAILVNGTVFFYENDFDTSITYADFYYLRAFDMYRQIVEKLGL
ncbi:unnamed protein product [Orchesella dallaii]|uniref:Glucuronyl hydrolase n=1 Tax=Orchesella dallaii TaxID=48710 RepID=A0ABP1QSK5_9HEXA